MPTRRDDPASAHRDRVLESDAAPRRDRGKVIGASHNAAGQERAFLWRGGPLIDLDTLDGGEVGTYSAGGSTHGFLWENRLITSFDAPVGTSIFEVDGFNDRGQIAGVSTDENGEHHAVVWEAGK